MTTPLGREDLRPSANARNQQPQQLLSQPSQVLSTTTHGSSVPLRPMSQALLKIGQKIQHPTTRPSMSRESFRCCVKRVRSPSGLSESIVSPTLLASSGPLNMCRKVFPITTASARIRYLEKYKYLTDPARMFCITVRSQRTGVGESTDCRYSYAIEYPAVSLDSSSQRRSRSPSTSWSQRLYHIPSAPAHALSLARRIVGMGKDALNFRARQGSSNYLEDHVVGLDWVT